MATKESIVQRLLDERAITAAEAVILLKEDVRVVQSPYEPIPWIQPYAPTTADPMYPYCDWTVRPEHLPKYEQPKDEFGGISIQHYSHTISNNNDSLVSAPFDLNKNWTEK
jgi:hypothetical protein